jgi:hypothetical protein
VLVSGFEERSVDTDATAQDPENDLGLRGMNEERGVEEPVTEVKKLSGHQ